MALMLLQDATGETFNLNKKSVERVHEWDSMVGSRGIAKVDSQFSLTPPPNDQFPLTPPNEL
jgi:hypothetical protein